MPSAFRSLHVYIYTYTNIHIYPQMHTLIHLHDPLTLLIKPQTHTHQQNHTGVRLHTTTRYNHRKKRPNLPKLRIKGSLTHTTTGQIEGMRLGVSMYMGCGISSNILGGKFAWRIDCGSGKSHDCGRIAW